MKYFLLGIWLLLMGPLCASAATVTLVQEPTQVGQGDTVNVVLDLQSTTTVNAFSGTLYYPSQYLEPVSISDGNSIISFWITHPEVTPSGFIPFAGVTPGGFVGTNGKLFSVVFRAKKEGGASLFIPDLRILQNDGLGTSEPTNVASTTLQIDHTPTGGYVAQPDTTAPEAFIPYIVRSPEHTNVVVFSSTDKGSGIKRWDVAEERFSFAPLEWIPAQSPYTLRDQYLTSDVYVRATDHAGNIQTALVRRQKLVRPYEWIALGVIILVLMVATLLHMPRTKRYA